MPKGSQVPRISAPKSVVTGGTTHQKPVKAKPGMNGKGPVGR